MPQQVNRRAIRLQDKLDQRSNAGRTNIQLILLVVIVAVLLVGAWIYLSTRPSGNVTSGRTGSPTMIVDQDWYPAVSAVKDIPAGTVITRDALKETEVARRNVSGNYLGSIEQIEGRAAKKDISNGEIITNDILTPKKRTARKSILRHADSN